MRLFVDVKPIMSFMAQHYTDERLAMLRAHAEDGKLQFASCCCFIGVATADHALAGYTSDWEQPHFLVARALDKGIGAEWTAGRLRYVKRAAGVSNATMRAYLLPLILWEQRRRDRLHAAQQEAVEVAQA